MALSKRDSVAIPDDPSAPDAARFVYPLGDGVILVNNEFFAQLGKDGSLSYFSSPSGAGHLLSAKRVGPSEVFAIYLTRSYTVTAFRLNSKARKWNLLGEFLTEFNEYHQVSLAVNENKVFVMNGWAHAGVNEAYGHMSLDGGRTWKAVSVPTFGEAAFSGAEAVVVATDESGNPGWFTSTTGEQWAAQPNPFGEKHSLRLDRSSTGDELVVYGDSEVVVYDQSQREAERGPKWGTGWAIGKAKRLDKVGPLPFDLAEISDGYLRSDGIGLITNRQRQKAAVTESGGSTWTVISLG